MTTEKLIALAKECGFSAAAPMDPKQLVFREEVRSMCASGRCQMYNKTWACPPACGDIKIYTDKAAEYSFGLLVQTVGQREDEFDFEALASTGKEHEAHFNLLTEKLYERYPAMHPMGAGTCTRCEKCTYPDAPCRFPQYLHPSMEACGLVVSEVCQACGLPYYYGPNSITYSGCYLLY